MPEPWEDPQEEIRDLLETLSRRLKGGMPSSRFLVLIAAAVVAALAALSSIYTVGPDQKAVVLRLGRYAATQGPGLHFRLPFGIDQVVKLPTERILHESFGSRADRSGERVVEQEASMLTGDLNVANVEWIVQYKISDPRKFLFNTRDVRKNLRDVSQSVLRRVVGDRMVSEVLTTGRVEIADDAKRLTQEVLDHYDAGIRVLAVKLQDVNPPPSVQPAFNEVNAAKQEQEKVINEAEREYNRVIPAARGKAEEQIRNAEGYAARVLNHAKGDAARFRQVLAAYRTAPQVTRTRLYLETLEEIYGRFQQLTIVDKGVQGLLPVFQEAKPAAAGGQGR